MFGREHMVEKIAASPDLIMFGSQAQFSGRPHVVEVAVTDPTPVYPWSLMWHELNRHPSLPRLIDHVRAQYKPQDARGVWLPAPDRPLVGSGQDDGIG